MTIYIQRAQPGSYMKDKNYPSNIRTSDNIIRFENNVEGYNLNFCFILRVIILEGIPIDWFGISIDGLMQDPVEPSGKLQTVEFRIL